MRGCFLLVGWPIAIDLHGLDVDVDDGGAIRVASVRVSGASGTVALREPRVDASLVAHVRVAGEPRAQWLQLDAIEVSGARFDTVVSFVAAGHGDLLTVVAAAVRREIETRLPRSGVYKREDARDAKKQSG